MIECPDCHQLYSIENTKCGACGNIPAKVDGFISWTAQVNEKKGGFNENYFSVLSQLEEKHFWFKSRNRLILWMLKKYCPDFKSFLEIGCGTGYVLSGVSNTFPGRQLYGSDIFTSAFDYAAKRLPGIEFMQMDARNIPFRDEFDVIGLFDVLEHIQDDRKVLRQVNKALKKNGSILLTMPQHKWLWSTVDERSLHVRRYTRRELNHKLSRAGFQIVCDTSFVTLLLPLLVAVRMTARIKSNYDSLNELRINTILNRMFERAMDLEWLFIRKGFCPRIGGSTFILARKIRPSIAK